MSFWSKVKGHHIYGVMWGVIPLLAFIEAFQYGEGTIRLVIYAILGTLIATLRFTGKLGKE